MTPEAQPSADRPSQTLARGLDIVDIAREGPVNLSQIMARLDLTRSTAHRLASALVERRFLAHDARSGYRLGPKLLHLAFQASEAINLPTLARPALIALSEATEDAVNLAVRAGDEIIYVAQAPGRRRVAVRHRVGDRNRLSDTALGRALLLDADDADWARYFPDEGRYEALAKGVIFHLASGSDQICCIAAPIRDASGSICAAVSLSSIPQYMDEARMAALGPRVALLADQLSERLGWFNRGR